MSEILNDIRKVMEMLPHRYPFLLVDKIIEIKPNESATVIKNVTFNEPFFQGHFPNNPVMPGVLIVEALAQTGIILVAGTASEMAGKTMYLMSIEKANFRKIVQPGDTMYLTVSKVFARQNAWKLRGEAKVNDVVVADAEFAAILAQNDSLK